MVGRFADVGTDADKSALLVITGERCCHGR